MHIAFDTNVVLDVLLKRDPFFDDAAALFAYVYEGALNGTLGATTLTTVFYIARKRHDRARAFASVRRLLALFEVAPVERAALSDALQAGFADYEDGVLHEAARHHGAHGLVTRDLGDFEGATLTVYEPPELLAAIESQ